MKRIFLLLVILLVISSTSIDTAVEDGPGITSYDELV